MYYGCDTNSDSSPCSSADFYIGEIGYGVTQSLANFNTNASNAVGAINTFAYWFVEGPDSSSPPATSLSAAYNWGQQQADQAAQAWNSNYNVDRVTLFADIEGTSYGQNGWDSNQALNQKVWEGFFNELSSNPTTGTTLKPGLYATNYQWGFIMGSSYGVPAGTPVWSADDQNVSGISPCGSCPSSFPSLPAIGGVTPTLWQYNGTPGCPNDLDAATSLPS